INTILFSQNSISIDSCIFYAKNHYALLKNNPLNQNLSNLHIKNFNTNFYPHLNFEAKASYQSQTIDIDIDTQGLPPGVEFQFLTPPLDQYNMSININQNIYDGGFTKQLKQIENKKLVLQNLNNEIAFQQIKEKVNEIFFGILILQKTEEQIKHSLNELQERRRTLRSGVKNGIVTQENYDLISATILLTQQKLIEIQENITAGYAVLSEIIGKIIFNSVQLYTPDTVKLVDKNIRPEISVFNTQNELSEANILLIKSKKLPKLGVFAVGGYGNPGLTLIKDEWNPYFIVGAKLNWNIWDWNNSSRDRQIQKIKETSILNQKETFNQSINIRLIKLKSEIEKYHKLSEYDLKILTLHKKICAAVSNKLQNGTANSVDYISALNAKEQTAIQYEIHKLKILKYKYEYLIVTGNL
ncbi:MAG: TolC family protein, partial [Chlorobi bacterium]|nr:TolC family protein [Chlorobiota bacterium]